MEKSTLTELRKVAKEKGVKGYSTLKKDELMKVLGISSKSTPTKKGKELSTKEKKTPPSSKGKGGTATSSGSFLTYIRKILATNQEEQKITADAIKHIEKLVNDAMTKIIREHKGNMFKASTVAVNKVLGTGLGKYAICQGDEAVKEGSCTVPTAKMEAYIKGVFKGDVPKDGALYMAGVYEFLAAELLEFGGDIASKDKRVTIKREDIDNAINGDTRLKKVFG